MEVATLLTQEPMETIQHLLMAQTVTRRHLAAIHYRLFSLLPSSGMVLNPGSTTSRAALLSHHPRLQNITTTPTDHRLAHLTAVMSMAGHPLHQRRRPLAREPP